MKALTRPLFGIAIFQFLSTMVGFVQLLVVPPWYKEALDPTPFAGMYVLAAFLLGFVGLWQLAAIIVHRKAPQWIPLAQAAAGTVMVGWIAGECLAMNSFVWPHALWGGVGVIQLLLVLELLGVRKPFRIEPAATDATKPNGVVGKAA